MKKLFLLVSIIGLLIPLVSAQTSFFASDDSMTSGEYPIVRSWDDGNAAITFYVQNQKKYVQYVNYLTGNSRRSEDTIATAYMHTYVGTGVVTSIVRVFDIDNMVMVNSQEYTVPEKSEVANIVYIPEDKSLVCMHDFKTPLGAFNTNFVYLDPYATNTYNTDIEYRKAEFFGSLTRKGNKHYLASMGPKWFLKDKMMLGSYPNPTCPSTEAIKANILENYLEIDVSNILPYDNDSKPIIIDMSSVEQRTVSIICSNP